MNRPLHILGIDTTTEFGPKYKATINGFLRTNNCGESAGYFFTRVPIKGGVTEAIFLLGTRGYVVVDYQFAPLSCGMIHPTEEFAAMTA